MFGRKKSGTEVQIQACQCGGIHVYFGNVSVHMQKNEFMAMADKVQKAKNFLSSSTQPIQQEVHHEIH